MSKLNAFNIESGVIFMTSPSATYAYKVVACEEYEIGDEWFTYWVYQSGKIKDGEFVSDYSRDSLHIVNDKSLFENEYFIWSPTVDHEEGAILIARDGTVVVAGEKKPYLGEEGVRRYWYIRTGGDGWDRLETVIRNHGELSVATNVIGKKFIGAKLV